MSAEKHDIDPIETQEWLDALSSVLENEGSERAHFLLENLVRYTRRRGVHPGGRGQWLRRPRRCPRERGTAWLDLSHS